MVTRSPNPPSHLSAGMAYGLAAALIWGAWPVVSRLGVQQTLGVAEITALRFLVAGLILLPIAVRRGLQGVGWGRSLVLACGGGMLYVLAAVGGLSFAPASHAGVITPSTMLVVSTVGGWLWLGERPDVARISGIAVIMVGVTLIGWQSLTADGGGDLWIGHLLFVAAGALWASYTLGTRAWAVEPVHATAIVSVLSMAVAVPAYLVAGSGAIWRAPVSEILFQGIFQGVLAAILALFCYTRAVALLGAGRGAVFASLVPGIALLLAYPVLDEALGPREIAGVVAVTFGMVWALGLGQRWFPALKHAD